MALNWGIAAAGKISHDFVTALGTLPDDEHKVVAVAARKEEDAQEFAKLHCISKAYGGYEVLAMDPSVGEAIDQLKWLLVVQILGLINFQRWFTLVS